MSTSARSPINPWTGHLPTLDGWRALAVLLVIFSHLPESAAWSLKGLGPLGVSIFFSLSGLLICNRLLAESAQQGRIDLRAFALRRASRILPPALAFLLTLAGLAALDVISVPWATLRSCLFLYRNYLPNHDWYTSHFWSLNIEEHFYLVFPACLCVLGPGRALLGSVGLAGVVVIWRSLDQRWQILSGTAGLATPYCRTDCRIDELLLGCATALVTTRFPDRASSWPARLAGGLGAVVLMLRLAGFPVPGIIAAALIPWTLVLTVLHPASRVGRFLEWAPLAWLGRMSYGLYLWQQLFLAGYPGNRNPHFGFLHQTPWNLLAVLAVATLSYYVLEQPIIRRVRDWTRQLPSTPRTEPTTASLPYLRDRRRPLPVRVEAEGLTVRERHARRKSSAA